MYTTLQIREIFHFYFLDRLLKISDTKLYVLKGGVNLRFFFHSPRYSEDMDLDVTAGSVATLRKNGYKIIEDSSFRRGLRTFGIDDIIVNDPSKAKHTETTQRFRLQLISSSGEALPTKVEFSRRAKALENVAMDIIDPEVSRQYKKLSFRCQHYPGDVAVMQKLNALAGRPVSQARDVFDLGILHLGGFTQDIKPNRLLSKDKLKAAEQNLLSLSFEDFLGQVVEFLGDDAKAEYGNEQTWGEFQEIVYRLLSDE